MPLIIMSGYPSSGKTTKCQELKDFLEKSEGKTVHVVTEDANFDKNYVYAESSREKNVRSDLKAAVQRHLCPENVVILDSLNYIKGYRYELYCMTKSANTTHCVVHCSTSKDMCTQWNWGRDEGDRYTTDILDALLMRFEPPNPQTRWDSPLFVIQEGDTLPCAKIAESLFHRNAPAANLSTISQPLSSTNFLYDLDKITKDIVASVIESQKYMGAGDSIAVPGASEKLTLSRSLTMMELQRYRRQFITYTKTHPIKDSNNVSNMFIQYLQGIIS